MAKRTMRLAHLTHNNIWPIRVTVGQKINKGDLIGTMGKTGIAYGDHVHLDVSERHTTDAWNSWTRRGLPECRDYIEGVFNSQSIVTLDYGAYLDGVYGAEKQQPIALIRF